MADSSSPEDETVAEPVPSRTSQSADEENNSQVPEPAVDLSLYDHLLPDDWELNVFLVELADEITSEDLEKLKIYISGNGGTGRRVLSEITDPLKLFEHLRTRRMLDRNNILLLQGMLWNLGREDLVAKFRAYARNIGNQFYLCKPLDNEENGFIRFKCHVKGSINGFNRNHLEQIRQYVAKVLIIPPETVFVEGMEPSNSINLTFKVPDLCKICLSSLTLEEKCGFAVFGIDYILLDATKISMDDTTATTLVQQPSEQTEIDRLFLKVQYLEKELEQNQIQILEDEKIMKELRIKLGNVDPGSSVEMNFMMLAAAVYSLLQIKFNFEQPIVESLTKQSALVYFKHTMKKVREKNYDIDLIGNLIEANAAVVKGTMMSLHQSKMEAMHRLIRDLHSKLLYLQYEKDKLAYYLNFGLKNPILSAREEFFLANLMKGVKIDLGIQIGTELKLSDAFKDLLKKMSKDLRKREKFQLQNSTPVPFTEAEKKTLSEAPNMLLEVLVVKALLNTGANIDIGQYLVKILASINRLDLIRRFEEFHQSQTRTQPTQHFDGKTHSGSGRRKSRQKHSSGDLKPGTSKSNVDVEESSKLNELSDEMKHMKGMLQDILKNQKEQSSKDSFYPNINGLNGFNNWFNKSHLKYDQYNTCT